MYEYICGTITKITPKYIVIENNGIGYLVYVSNPYEFKMDEFLKLYVYLQIREDGHDLFGFREYDEKDLFLKLISVKGIGPRSALPILASGSVSEITNAIALGNASYLQKFPGIGAKASQQIILDLKNKMGDGTPVLFKDDLSDCEEALIALGYNKKEVGKVLGKIDTTLPQNEIIKQALKLLSKL